jgi:hypothetical protein
MSRKTNETWGIPFKVATKTEKTRPLLRNLTV